MVATVDSGVSRLISFLLTGRKSWLDTTINTFDDERVLRRQGWHKIGKGAGNMFLNGKQPLFYLHNYCTLLTTKYIRP